jgi:hypothetical protein
VKDNLLMTESVIASLLICCSSFAWTQVTETYDYNEQ